MRLTPPNDSSNPPPTLEGTAQHDTALSREAPNLAPTQGWKAAENAKLERLRIAREEERARFKAIRDRTSKAQARTAAPHDHDGSDSAFRATSRFAPVKLAALKSDNVKVQSRRKPISISSDDEESDEDSDGDDS